jgi:hypothetical protein
MYIRMTVSAGNTNMTELKVFMTITALNIYMCTKQSKSGLIMIEFPPGYVIPILCIMARFTIKFKIITMRITHRLLA